MKKNDWGQLVRSLSDVYNDLQVWEKGYKMNNWDEIEAEYEEACEDACSTPRKKKYNYEKMLRAVMEHLRETGADTFEVLRDNELNEWWGAEVAKIEAAERKIAAVERAMSVLSPEERKALGLKF